MKAEYYTYIYMYVHVILRSFTGLARRTSAVLELRQCLSGWSQGQTLDSRILNHVPFDFDGQDHPLPYDFTYL